MRPTRCGRSLSWCTGEAAAIPFSPGSSSPAWPKKRLVEFDPRSRSWTWNLDAIVDKKFSDNPVDLMIGRLRRLAPEAQEALKLLACLGNHADFATLAKLRSESDEAMHASFRDAVRAGAAVPREGSYRFFHDRVQEAAYALIPTEGRAELHLRIARLLVAETVQERIAEKIYDLVNQLNLGSALISEWPEKVRAAELNFVAGRKAKASTAYASASNYLAAGIAVLSDEGWQRSYDLMLGLFLERAECEILNSNLEQAAGLVEALLIKARSKIDQAEICRLRMLLQLRQGNYAPAVRTALECLRTFGVDLPDSPTPEQMRAEYEEMRRTLGERPIESLVDLPMMDDPEMRAVMKLFSALGELAYHADGDLFQMISCWMVKLTLSPWHKRVLHDRLRCDRRRPWSGVPSLRRRGGLCTVGGRGCRTIRVHRAKGGRTFPHANGGPLDASNRRCSDLPRGRDPICRGNRRDGLRLLQPSTSPHRSDGAR